MTNQEAYDWALGVLAENASHTKSELANACDTIGEAVRGVYAGPPVTVAPPPFRLY